MTFPDNYLSVGGVSPSHSIQFLDHSNRWCDVNSLAPDVLVTNRFPLQVFYDSEEAAGPVVAHLKAMGFITTMEE